MSDNPCGSDDCQYALTPCQPYFCPAATPPTSQGDTASEATNGVSEALKELTSGSYNGQSIPKQRTLELAAIIEAALTTQREEAERWEREREALRYALSIEGCECFSWVRGESAPSCIAIELDPKNCHTANALGECPVDRELIREALAAAKQAVERTGGTR